MVSDGHLNMMQLFSTLLSCKNTHRLHSFGHFKQFFGPEFVLSASTVCYCRVYDSNVNTRKSMTNLFGLKGRCPPLWTDFYVITQWLSACLKCFDYRIFTLFFSGSFSQVFSVAKTDTRTLLALRWRELSTSWANSLWSLQQRFF